MSMFRGKPVVVEAVRWNGHGDHPAVQPYGWDIDPITCFACGHKEDAHGFIETLEGNHVICPGDWIVKSIDGEYFPCKHYIFAAIYEEINNG